MHQLLMMVCIPDPLGINFETVDEGDGDFSHPNMMSLVNVARVLPVECLKYVEL